MSIKAKKVLLVIALIILFGSSIVIGVFLSRNNENLFGTTAKSSKTTEKLSIETTVKTISKIKIEKPQKIRGIWFTAGVDYLNIESDSIEKVKIEIETKISDIFSMGFNTILLDYTDNISKILITDKTVFSAFEYCIEYAHETGLFVIVSLPIKDYLSLSNNFILNDKKIEDFCSKNNFDTLLVSGLSKFELEMSDLSTIEKKSKLHETIAGFVNDAITADNQLIISAQLDADNVAMLDLAKDLFVNTITGFIYVEPITSSKDKVSSYTKVLKKWDTVATNVGGNYLFGQRADLLFSNISWNDPTEIIVQSTAANSMENCTGTAVRSYSSIKSDKKGSGKIYLNYLGNLILENTQRKFAVYNQTSTNITTNESKVSFTGGCSPNFPLFCNNKAIELTKSGDFSVEFNLKVGKNAFVFKHNGKSYNYNITYEIDLLKSISPKGKISAPGGTAIEISTVALRNAEVYAVINSKTLAMNRGDSLDFGDEDRSPDISSDFVTYYGKYTLPVGKSTEQNLGNITVYAKFNGLSKNISGAKVVVSAIAPATTQPPTTTQRPTTTKPPTTTKVQTTTQQTTTFPVTSSIYSDTTSPYSNTFPFSTMSPFSTTLPALTSSNETTTISSVQQKQLTPYSFAGVFGISRMCEVTKNYSETMPISPLNDLSCPLTTPLLTGMFDYVDSESNYGEYLYYNLRSGRRVSQGDVKLIESGYNLPSNKINVINSGTSGDTYLNLAMSWKVPVNAEIKGQSYSKLYNTREFGVLNFTGNCIEFTFFNTDDALGNVNVSGSNVISNAEWVEYSSQNKVVLRLSFEKVGAFYGYSIAYNSDGSLKILIKEKPSTSLSGYTIMLDPGHGGSGVNGDSGAVCSSTSPSTMKYEKQINLILATKIKERLEANGATVLMTRTGDDIVSLDSRANMVRTNNPDLFISIHCDASTRATANGTSAYYYYAQSFPLANSIQKQILSCYNNYIYPTTDRHTVFWPYRVVKVEDCPSILLEYGYVSNLIECLALQKTENQNLFADATVQGIKDYISFN